MKTFFEKKCKSGDYSCLICHDHQFAVSELVEVGGFGVFAFEVEAHCFYNILDFLVAADLHVTGFAAVEQLTAQREHSVKLLLPRQRGNPSHGCGFG